MKAESEMIAMEKCPQADICSAPLCPFVDPTILKDRYWYPDDPICRRRGVIAKYSWIRTQKKIFRTTKDMTTCYTYQMLNRSCVIGKGMIGIDTDRPEEPQIERWFKAHPPKIELSEEKKRLLKERLSPKNRGASAGISS